MHLHLHLQMQMHLQASMLATLGKPEQALARRRTRVQDLATFDSEMESLEGREGEGVRGATVLSCLSHYMA